jgi:hypothetical protein
MLWAPLDAGLGFLNPFRLVVAVLARVGSAPTGEWQEQSLEVAVTPTMHCLASRGGCYC